MQPCHSNFNMKAITQLSILAMIAFVNQSCQKEIDLKTIQRGLGWQLYDWSNFVLNDSNADAKYKEFKKETYMTPESILETINTTYTISDELNTNQ